MNKKALLLSDFPRIHSTPLANITSVDSKLLIELDDINEKRFCLCFNPYQAFQVITADCYSPPVGITILLQGVYEIFGSSWINRLEDVALKCDHDSTFMKKSRHFIIPLQDQFLEVIAWDIQLCSPMERTSEEGEF